MISATTNYAHNYADIIGWFQLLRQSTKADYYMASETEAIV